MADAAPVTESGAAHVPPLPALCVLVCISGVLDATAILNLGGNSITVYMGATGLLFVALFMSALLAPAAVRVPTLERDELLFVGGSLLLLIVGVTAHLIAQTPNQSGSATQIVARSALLFMFLAGIIALRTLDARGTDIVRLLRAITTVYLLYGIYDLVAQLLGLPRIFDFLRNSLSIAVNRQFGAQGWALLPRISSFAAEPSHTVMVNALALFVALWPDARGKRSRGIAVLAVLFAAGTLSRSAWAALGAASLAVIAYNLLVGVTPAQWKRLVRTAGANAALLVPVAVLFVSLQADVSNLDWSAQEREDTKRAGLAAFAAHPWIGAGLQNWREETFLIYHNTLASPDTLPSGGIHNMFAGMAAALGILGIVFCTLPLLFIAFRTVDAPNVRIFWICVYAVAAQGTDIMYFGSTWLSLAAISVLAGRRAGALYEGRLAGWSGPAVRFQPAE